MKKIIDYFWNKTNWLLMMLYNLLKKILNDSDIDGQIHKAIISSGAYRPQTKK